MNAGTWYTHSLLQAKCTAVNVASISVVPNLQDMWKMCTLQTMRLNAICAASYSRIRTLTSIICATLMGFIRVNKYFPPTDSFLLLGRSNWCDICSKSVVNFKRHMNDVHGTNNEVVCEFEGCGKVLKNAASWKYHLRNSHGVYQSKWFVGQLPAHCTIILA